MSIFDDMKIGNIIKIELRNLGLTTKDANDLAEALKDSNCKVTSIDLYWNCIGDEGAKAIAEALKDSNCKVTSIHLGYNKIGTEGAKAIAEALKDSNCIVTSINLDGNNIQEEGVKALKEAGWNSDTGEVTKTVDKTKTSGNSKAGEIIGIRNKTETRGSSMSRLLNSIGEHKGKFIMAGVAACAIVAACYKKPEILTSLKEMLSALFDKASGIVKGK